MGVFSDFFNNRLMKHEGGYVNHPNDPGGETMWGVTKRVAREHGYYGSMRKLPKKTAEKIAEKSYWDAVHAGEFDKSIAWQVLDASYNHGIRRSVKFLQAAAGLKGRDVDGIVGSQTIGVVNSADKNDILMLFNAERLEFYTRLRTWRTFGKGWARRIVGNLRWAAKDN